MNVLMISDVYFPRINGVSTSIETFRAELHVLGTQTTLIAPEYPGGLPENLQNDNVVRIPSRYLPMDPEDRMMKRSIIREWVKNYRGPAFDVVHVQTPFVAHYAGLEAGKLLGIPVVATYHTYFEEYLYHYIPWLPREWLRGAARRFSRGQCNALDALVVPSNAMADALKAYGITQPIHILPTGLPADRYVGGDGDFFRSRYDIPQERPLLLFVGRVAFEKNIGFLLDVVEKVRADIPDVLLLITGEGPALEDLRQEAATRGLSNNVRFLGYLDRHHELADCYRAADIFVFASRTETQGLVLLEAMALGKPVVALSIMGTRDILEPNHVPTGGALIAQDDAADFAAKTVYLLRDKALRERTGEAARAYARSWGAENMARKLNSLYINVRNGNPEMPPTIEALIEPAML